MRGTPYPQAASRRVSPIPHWPADDPCLCLSSVACPPVAWNPAAAVRGVRRHSRIHPLPGRICRLAHAQALAGVLPAGPGAYGLPAHEHIAVSGASYFPNTAAHRRKCALARRARALARSRPGTGVPKENLRRMRRDPPLGLHTYPTHRMHARPGESSGPYHQNLCHMLPLSLLACRRIVPFHALSRLSKRGTSAHHPYSQPLSARCISSAKHQTAKNKRD